MATISATLGVNANRLCVGEATRGDLGCPTYAPTISSGGLLTATTIATGGLTVTGNSLLAAVSATNISATGNISANRFIGQFTGDGSGLTGVIAAGTDRIISGTTSVLANNGGNIEFKTSNTITGYYTPAGLLAAVQVSTTGMGRFMAVSTTGNISGQDGLFTNLFGLIRTPAQPSITSVGSLTGLTVTGNALLAAVSATNISATGNISAVRFIGDGSLLTGVTASSANWYGLTGIPAPVQAVSNGTSLVMAGISATNSSVTTNLSVGGVLTAASAGFGPVAATSLNTGALTVTGNSVLAAISATNISATGNISAMRFIGDGSLLTGVTASSANWYGLTNIPAPVAAVSNGTSLVMAGISSTNSSVTTNLTVGGALTAGSAGFGPVAATTISTSGIISVTGLFTAADITATGRTITAGRFVGDGSGLTGMPSTATDRISSTNNQSLAVATPGGTISFTLGGTAGAAYLHPSLGLVSNNVSVTDTLRGITGIFGGLMVGRNSVASAVSRSAAFGTNAQAHGLNSFAAGSYAIASGRESVAFSNGQAAGLTSTAFGWGEANAEESVAFGSSEVNGDNAVAFNAAYIDADGYNSVAFNYGYVSDGHASAFNDGNAMALYSAAFNEASTEGQRSSAFNQSVAKSLYATTFGRFNVGVFPGSSAASWVGTDGLFEVGIGTNASSRANAFTILKSGLTGIMTATPTTALHISGTLRLANGAEACDADRVGGIRYTANEFSFCRNGTAWETLSSIASGGSPDWYNISAIPAPVQAVSNSTEITMARISATNISASTIQLSNAEGAACASGRDNQLKIEGGKLFLCRP